MAGFSFGFTEGSFLLLKPIFCHTEIYVNDRTQDKLNKMKYTHHLCTQCDNLYSDIQSENLIPCLSQSTEQDHSCPQQGQRLP